MLYISPGAEKVFGVRIGPEKYKNAVEAIIENRMIFSPHVIVGLDYGKINGELKALELLRGAGVDNICIIVLIPTKGTPMEGIVPPSPDIVGRITAIAGLMYPGVSINLGCVRPGKNYRQAIDEAAIRAGATKVAIPSSAAKKTAKELKAILYSLPITIPIRKLLTARFQTEKSTATESNARDFWKPDVSVIAFTGISTVYPRANMRCYPWQRLRP